MFAYKLSRYSVAYIDILVEGIKDSTGHFAIYAVQSFPRVIMDRLLARKGQTDCLLSQPCTPVAWSSLVNLFYY